jgi:glucose/arabinose dehydrogenase
MHVRSKARAARRFLAAAPVLALGLFVAAAAGAATLPAGFSESLVAGGLSAPTAMDFAPDGRLFVCEKGGRLRVVKNGTLLTAPFVSLTVNQNGERGLLGIAFDPAFASNQYVYVYYTATTPTVHNRVSRFTANGDVAVTGSEQAILDLPALSATNHNGGAIHFGPDGKLYVAVGENAVTSNSQALASPLGKMLRLNADGSFPTDNPFYNTAGAHRAVWALGLRNPYTFAFNPGSGAPAMAINDVGANTWEEINDGSAGANYGWPNTEGPTTNPSFVSPRYAYDHANSQCAITGGAFYAPPVMQFPADYLDDYFFADNCAGWIRRLDPNNGNTVTPFATGIPGPVDLKVGPDGALYYLAINNGTVYRVLYNNTAPTIATHPANLTVAPGQTAAFSVQASGVGTLRYQWQRDAVDIAGATAVTYTTPATTLADSGARFRVRVTNDFGNALSNDAVLTVAVPGTPPAPTGLAAYVNGLTVVLSWNASAGAASYRLEAGSSPGAANLLNSDVGGVTTLRAVAAAGTYYVRVRAVNAVGTSAASNQVTVATSGTGVCATPPPAPGGYTVQSAGLLARLSWNPSPGADSYVVEGGSASGQANLLVSNVGAVTTLDASGPAGTYYTRIRAVNACGVSAASAEVAVTLGCAGPPAAPTNLTFTKSGTIVSMSWTGVFGATSYRVSAGTAAGSSNVTVMDVGAQTSLQAGTAGVAAGIYYVRVAAISACGVSGPSNEIAVTLP